jgi:Rieske 2Fe-2S family protein
MSDRPPLPPNAFTLPGRYYTDPALFAREQDLFFRGMWMAVARSEDLAETGAFLTRDVAGDSILLVRTGPETPRDAGVAAFFNVCRHRGTTLCDAAAGTLRGSIQCPYHAWTYDFSGALIGAPHMEGTPHFRREDYPLRAVRAGVWGGVVFVNTANAGASFEQQLADLPDKFRPWALERLRRGARVEYDVAANWKLILQNYSECLHCPNLHPALNAMSHYMSGDNEPLRPTYMGGRMDLAPQVETMSTDGARLCRTLPALGDEERRRVYYYALFPNLLVSAHPDYVMTHTLQPLAPDRTRIVCEWLFEPSALAEPGFSADRAREFWDLTNRQDWHVCELAQQGVSSRGYVPGPYSNREELLYAFDRFVVALLG